jgi:oxygen-independent coproporphyrinogen-3 oxidase
VNTPQDNDASGTALATCPLGPPLEGTALYVHLPFCAAKCPYCDFFSVAGEGHDVDAMIDAILSEAERRAPANPRTVFFGGGTPSWLDTKTLERFLNGLDDLTGFRESAVEVTAECNPESLDLEKASCLTSLGVRRLSIGFQSLDAKTLELFGRVHKVDDSFRAFEAARAGGAEAINIDMIYAAPDQTAEAWASELRRVLALKPDHLAAYNLTYEPNTAFGKWLDEGRMSKTPDELELEMFETVHRITKEAGLHAYEISNYATPGQECTHNLNYWHNRAYVGIGPSAVSKIGRRRGGNKRSIPGYVKSTKSQTEIEWHEELAGPARLAETWWLTLRLRAGVEPAAARRHADWGSDPDRDPAVMVAQELSKVGLVEECNGRWILTAAGLPLADGVAAEFLSRTPKKAAELGLE